MFTVTFTTKNLDPVYNLPEKRPGLTVLDKFRCQYGTHIMRVLDAYASQEMRYVMPVDEETARQSQRFEDNGNVDVIVAPEFLNQFAEIVPLAPASTTQATMSTKWKLNNEKVLRAWVATNYPTTWEEPAHS